MKIGISVACWLSDDAHRTAMLKAFAASLQSQTHDDWMAVFVHDGPICTHTRGYSAMRHIVDGDHRFSLLETEKRLQCWGHPYRQRGIDLCLSLGCDWLGFSNDDNYYCPRWFEKVMAKAVAGANFVHTNMVHSFFDYGLLHCELKVCRIDVGAFLFSRELSELRFDAMPVQNGQADGLYVEAISRLPCFRPEKVESFMFVHN